MILISDHLNIIIYYHNHYNNFDDNITGIPRQIDIGYDYKRSTTDC